MLVGACNGRADLIGSRSQGSRLAVRFDGLVYLRVSKDCCVPGLHVVKKLRGQGPGAGEVHGFKDGRFDVAPSHNATNFRNGNRVILEVFEHQVDGSFQVRGTGVLLGDRAQVRCGHAARTEAFENFVDVHNSLCVAIRKKLAIRNIAG